ncbi:uncharacterized protein MELLADRAFT_85149 [Melampsora larici-populina 98AG31]|uniref:Uncharacterized protein n=1 Tax=Melampsora larici-populina (strain 98AG31 / pathotype 3-4-7) TaxID=747676 RepID=F4RHP3_MELLP|nr:uncharacterized protein MELLADRAFT_85149 [Melampsora larici-populina 98AG31]EGG07857.1 hypothetical protein MELLADRAFT_85149 [Melampsora larici-populina 98AG31]
MMDRRSRNQDLDIPLHRFYPAISPPIACLWAPLINVTRPTEPPLTNLPPPFPMQDPDFLRTIYEPRLREYVPPIQLFEVSESSEVEVSRPFVLFDLSDTTSSPSQFCAVNVDENILGFVLFTISILCGECR